MADNEDWLPGTFWLADDPDKKVHGRLYFSEDFRLELEGSLTSAMEQWAETDDEGNVVAIGGSLKSEEPGPFTVLGDLRGRTRKVSLFECMTVGRSGDSSCRRTPLRQSDLSTDCAEITSLTPPDLPAPGLSSSTVRTGVGLQASV